MNGVNTWLSVEWRGKRETKPTYDIHSTFQISGRESEKKKPSTFQISGMVIKQYSSVDLFFVLLALTSCSYSF